MDAVPIYNVNPGSNYGVNGWEAMALMNGGNNSGFGGNMGMWPFVLLLFLFGFGGGGFGGFGNRGNVAADMAATEATNVAEIKAGVSFSAQNAAAQGVKLDRIISNQCHDTASIVNAVTQGNYQAQLGQRDLQAQIANCCCTTQHSISAVNNNITQQFAQLNYNNAMQNCELKQAIAAEGAATRALINSHYAHELEIKLSEAKQQLFVYEKFGKYANNNGCGCNPCGGNSCGCGC